MTPEELDRWRTPRLSAHVWGCDDEVCNCTQPVIERLTPGERWPWVKIERVWEGTFHTEGEGYDESCLELTEAAGRFGIPLEPREPSHYPHGSRPDVV